MRKYIRRLIYCTIIGISFTSNGQTLQTPSGVSSFKFPKSPEAVAFEKYGNTPVSLFTGTPNISIPLPAVKGRELDFPISLAYDATGVKVDQVATNVGLGWNLNFGGRISRISNGRPDDLYSPEDNYYYESLYNAIVAEQFKFWQLSDLMEYFYLQKELSNGCMELLYDFYSLNVMGISDYLMWGSALNNPKIRGGNSAPGERTILGEDGTKYIFGQTEGFVETTTISGTDDSQNNHCPIGDLTSTTSWLLKKVISKNGLDIYEITYQKFNWQQSSIPAQEASSISNSQNVNSLSGNPTWDSDVINYSIQKNYTTTQLVPLKLVHNGKLVTQFKYKERTDLLFIAGQNGNAIDEIIYYDYNTNPANPLPTNILKSAKFQHSYFGDTNQSHLHKRLKLDGFTLYDGVLASASNSQTYSFDYFSASSVPPLNSKSQDLLGLFNAAGNSHLVPGAAGVGGANRTFNFSKAIIGTLSKITYPTKGHTDFEYEPHTAKAQNPTPQEIKQYVGTANAHYLDYNIRHEYMHPSMDEPSTGVGTDLMTITEGGTYYIESTPGTVYLISYPKCNDNTQEAYSKNIPDGPGLPQYIKPICGTPEKYPTVDMHAHTSGSFPAAVYMNYYSYYDKEIYLRPGVYQITVWCSQQGGGIGIYRKVNSYPADDTSVQGFRIKSIADYTAEGHTPQNPNLFLASKKEYKYLESLTSGMSSGYKLSYGNNYISYTTRVLDNQNAERYQQHIIRNASGYSTTPHLAYESVYEYLSNGSSSEGYIQHLFKKEQMNGGLVSDGTVLSYNKPARGNEWVTKVYDASNKLKSITTNNYEDKNFTAMKCGLSARVSYDNIDNYSYWYKLSAGGYYKADFEGKVPINWMGTWSYQTPRCFQNPMSAGCYYESAEHGTFDYNPNLGGNSYSFQNSFAYGWMSQLKSSETITYFDNTQQTFIKEKETFKYSDQYPYHLVETTKSNAAGDGSSPAFEILNGTRTKYTYLTDIDHRYNPEKIKEIFQYNVVNGSEELLSRQENFYTNYSTAHYVTEVQTAKGTAPAESLLIVDYDPITLNMRQTKTFGNNALTDVYESYIFGYNDMLPVAKISGVKYSEIPPERILAIKNQTNIWPHNETLLKQAFSNLRTAVPAALIQTYTYNPQVGVTSTTDTKGETRYYSYDVLGRLRNVQDTDRYFISSQQYHFKP